MNKKDAIIAAQNELRARTKHTNGFAYIFEPLDGDKNNWKYWAYPEGACFSYARGKAGMMNYIDLPAGVSTATHRMRYFIDFFNRNKGTREEIYGPAWKYIIQRSFFKPVFEKDTFKNQLENGVIFDMTKWRWRAIICAAISLRFMWEYEKAKSFTALKKAGLKEREAFITSWFTRMEEDGKNMSFPACSGHALINTGNFTVDSFNHYLSGQGIVLIGDASKEARDAMSTEEMNIKNTGDQMYPRFRVMPGSKKTGGIWDERLTAPVSAVVTFIKQLDKK